MLVSVMLLAAEGDDAGGDAGNRGDGGVGDRWPWMAGHRETLMVELMVAFMVMVT